MTTPAGTRVERAQDRFDRLVVVAAGLAILGVGLQLTGSGGVHSVGVGLAGLSWAIFAADATVMISISPAPLDWARGHRLELVLLVVTFPAWPLLLHRLLLLELTPALTVLEAAKLAKLVKAASAVHVRGRGPVLAGFVIVLAAAVGVLVLWR